MDRRVRDRAPWALLAALAVVCVIVIVYAGATSTAAFGPYTASWEGTSELRTLADDGERTATVARNTSAYDETTPADTVAIVLAPDATYAPAEADRVRRFVEQGGTLLVADARDGPTNPLLGELNASARIDGAPLRDETEYAASPDFPETATVGNHSAVDGVETVVLNHGSAVEPGNASVQVTSSPYGYLDRDRTGTLDEDANLSRYPVLTVEPVGDGEVILVSDPSAFTNVMLDYGDNRRLLENLLAPHDAVVLDVSHADPLPPLALALVSVRESMLVQVLLIAAGLAGVAVLGRRGLPVRRPWRTDPTRDGPAPRLERARVRDYLARRHPDWDPDRLDRVSQAIVADTAADDGDPPADLTSKEGRRRATNDRQQQ